MRTLLFTVLLLSGCANADTMIDAETEGYTEGEATALHGVPPVYYQVHGSYAMPVTNDLCYIQIEFKDAQGNIFQTEVVPVLHTVGQSMPWGESFWLSEVPASTSIQLTEQDAEGFETIAASTSGPVGTWEWLDVDKLMIETLRQMAMTNIVPPITQQNVSTMMTDSDEAWGEYNADMENAGWLISSYWWAIEADREHNGN